MQSINIKNLDLGNINSMMGGNLSNEIKRLEQERASWMSTMTRSHSLAEQLKRLEGETSRAAQMAKQVKDLEAFSLAGQVNRLHLDNSAIQIARQWHDSQNAAQESIRRMLGPFQDIRNGFLKNSAAQRVLDDLAKPLYASEQLAKLMKQATGSNAFMETMNSSIEGSIGSARKMLADTSISSSIGQLMKSFEEANKRWIVPQPLLDSLGSLQALQEKMGRLSFPVIDAASAATLAKVLGPEGIQAQLVAMGINPDGSINVQVVKQEEGIGLSRKTLELMALLSFIFAVLVPIYQEIGSSQWQAATDKTLAEQTKRMEAYGDAIEGQRTMIEALTKLVENALVQEAKRQEERFVVLDRVTEVRSKPEHGAAIDGKLLPREVVRPILERGKWIEFEYYHWLHKEHRTGWALKKYFQRVPTNYKNPA